MTDPTQSVHVRRVYYASGTPPVLPVLYDDQYDSLPSTNVLDPVLQYDGQRGVVGYVWNGTRQVISGGDSDPIGDALRADAVAYWKMDEAGGTRADATGNNRDLLAIGTVNSVSGKINNAAELTTADDNGLKIMDDPVFESLGLNTVTFWGWAKINDFGPTGQDHTIFYTTFKTNGGLLSIGFYIAFNTFNNGVFMDAYNAGSDEITYIEHPATITEGVYFFFVSSIDADAKQSILVINESVETQAFLTDPVAFTAPVPKYSLSIGSEISWASPNTPSFQMNGHVDELGCVQRLLTSDERAYLYNIGAGRTLYP